MIHIILGAWKILETRAEAKPEGVGKIIPAVRAIATEPENVRLSIHSQGTVTASTVTDLVSEVSGKIFYVSPSLVAGGVVEKGDVLLRIDPYDNAHNPNGRNKQ